jgi:possible choline sulfatase
MQDDFTIFWRNDEHASALFYDLLDRAERGAYDDAFLAQLAAYREAAPESERADIFAARYLLHHGDAENAALCGERAYAKRPVNLEIWKILATAYRKLGKEFDAVGMAGHILGMYREEKIDTGLPKEHVYEALLRFSMSANNSASAPLLTNRASIENSCLTSDFDIFLGEEIPLSMPAESDRFWVGTFVDEGFLSAMATVYEPLRHNPNFIINNRDVTFDIQKARTVKGTVHIDIPKGKSAVVPVAGTAFYQNFTIRTETEVHAGYLGKWAFSYFKFNESVSLTSEGDQTFAVGTPILLGHSPQRKKLVLNILIDGLAWPAARAVFTAQMPRIANFFSRGVIFDQHFSASEYTLPSLPSIETGRYPHHTQVFNQRNTHAMPLTIQTLSEQMSSLGYYVTAPLVSGQGLYYGSYRGYHRLIANGGFMPAYEGTERTLRTLEAFRDTDQFIFYHATDVHPLNIQTPAKFSTEAELNVALADRFVPLDPAVSSVRTPRLPIYLEQFLVSLRHIDRNVGEILSYIEEHYNEDEYIVSLYSDHGCGLFDPSASNKEIDMVGEYGTGSTWMMRGAGVPEGIIADELTSAVDIYPTLAHLCGFDTAPEIDGNLPAVFGGTPRDAVYSSSQYPGQTFKLAIRTHDHTLRLETQESVDEDGTVDFAGAAVGIYPRDHELEAEYRLDSEELRTFFYPRARDFVRSIANNGEFWPAMRAARPEWFSKKN